MTIMNNRYCLPVVLAVMMMCLVASSARSFDVSKGSIKKARKDVTVEGVQVSASDVPRSKIINLKGVHKTTSRMLLACEDLATQCASWQSKGYCHPTYQFKSYSVKDYWCPKSCKVCSVTDKEQPTASGPTPGLRPVTIALAGTMYPICLSSKVFTTTGNVAWGYEVNDYCPIKGKGCSCVVLHDAEKPGPAPKPNPAPVPAPSLEPAPEPDPEPEPAVQSPVANFCVRYAESPVRTYVYQSDNCNPTSPWGANDLYVGDGGSLTAFTYQQPGTVQYCYRYANNPARTLIYQSADCSAPNGWGAVDAAGSTGGSLWLYPTRQAAWDAGHEGAVRLCFRYAANPMRTLVYRGDDCNTKWGWGYNDPEMGSGGVMWAPAADMSGPGPFADVLARHNHYRELHAVPNLVWDTTLASKAQAWADNCKWARSVTSAGENLAMGYSSQVAAVDAWYDEIKAYDFMKPAFAQSTAHFTQLVWRTTRRVGCGLAASCPGLYPNFLVCHYDPTGNIKGEFADHVWMPTQSGK